MWVITSLWGIDIPRALWYAKENGVSLTVDRRMLPGETYQQVTAELQEILERLKPEAPEIDYQVKFTEWNEPVETPLDSPLIEALKQNIEEQKNNLDEHK